jgi:HEAT repeat protein
MLTLGCSSRVLGKVPPMRTGNRLQVLQSIPHHPGVLINIRSSLFPATWDITLVGQRATRALRKGLLGNTDAGVRWRCAQVLTQLRDASSRGDLHQALGDWDAAVRGQVLQALANVGDGSSVPNILKRLKDPQESMSNRMWALRALGKLGDGRAANAIIAEYDRTGAPVMLRRAAVEALWDLRRRVPRDKLLALLRRAIKDSDPLVVRRASIGVGVQRDAKAIAALQARLMGTNPMLRNVAAYVLGRIGDKRAIPVLVKALPRVRSGRLLNNISFALRRLGDPNLWGRLKGFLNHRQAFIRLNAGYTVGEMQLKQAVPTLRRMLKDPTRLVRIQAVVALAKIGDRGSINALLKYAEDGPPDGRWLARLAVLYLSGDRRHHEPFLEMLAGRRRRDAALVLAQRGDARAAPTLYQLASAHRDRRVWVAARRLGDPTLDRLVLLRLRNDVRQGRLVTLDRTLAFAGSTQLKPLTLPLLDLLFSRWGATRNQRHVAQRPALRAVLRTLGLSGATTVRPWLDHFARHRDYHVRTEARLAQALLGDGDAARRLVDELVTASDHHRPYLARVLGRLPRNVVAPLVRRLLGRKDPFLKLALAAVLYRAEPGAGEGLKLLLASLRSPQATVRAQAMKYLTQAMTSTRHKTLLQAKRAERDGMAREALAMVTERYSPPLEMFRVFHPQQVILR